MTAGGDVDGVSVGEVDGAAEVSKGGGETAALALAAGVNDATGEELSMSDTLTEAEALRDDVAVRLAEALSDGDELDVAVRGGVAEDDHVSDAVCEDKGVELGLVTTVERRKGVERGKFHEPGRSVKKADFTSPLIFRGHNSAL